MCLHGLSAVRHTLRTQTPDFNWNSVYNASDEWSGYSRETGFETAAATLCSARAQVACSRIRNNSEVCIIHDKILTNPATTKNPDQALEGNTDSGETQTAGTQHVIDGVATVGRIDGGFGLRTLIC